MNLKLMELVGTFPPDASDQAVLNALSLKDQTVTDRTLYSYRELVKRFGPTLTNQVLGKLKAAAAQNPLLDITYQALANQGIDFSDTAAQSMLAELVTAKVFSADEAKALREIGIRTTSALDRAELVDITIEDINEARRDQRYRSNVIERIRNAYNGAIPLATAGTLTREQWIAFHDDVLEGFDSVE